MSETLDLRPDGLRFWELVKEGPLLVRAPALSYYYHLFQVFFLGGLLLVLASAFVPNGFLRVGCWLLVIFACGVFVWQHWSRERPFGALMALISKRTIEIGCKRDSIRIPWMAVATDMTELPVNNSFMAIPVSQAKMETILFLTNEESIPWDQKPYRRGILTIKYNSQMSWIEVYANPNGFFVDILTIVYPMICIWLERRAASAGEPSADD